MNASLPIPRGSKRSATADFRADVLARLGFAPPEIVGDGKIHRFSTSATKHNDAGWYLFHDDDFPAGSFGDWRTGEKFKWRARETREMSQQERERLEALKAEREKKIEAAYSAAAASANKQWSNAKPAGADHAYLVKKGVAPHGLRENYGRLLVPVCDGESIISLQTIDADGEKLFIEGSRVAGGYHVIGEIGETVIVGEGYATCATIHEATGLAVVVALNSGNLLAVAPKIRAKYPMARIIIAGDDDYKTAHERGFNPGLRDAKKAADAVKGIVAVPPFDRKAGDTGTDWNDLASAKGKEAVSLALKSAIDEAEIARLATLNPMEYDRARKDAAKALDVRPDTLDKQVKARREETAADKAIELCTDIEPYSEPVNTAELLNDIRATIARFIVCDPPILTATALWIAFTWTIEHVHIAPLAIITAPEKGCGKTQLLDVIGRLSRRNLFASNISPAATFRIIEAKSPTLLIDEFDSFFGENEELRGVINSGHTRTSAYVIRTIGDDFEVKQFSTWSAKALAGIGRLPETVMSRGIVLSLRRKLKTEKVERLRHAAPGLFDLQARKLARFGEDHGAAIGRARPALPDALSDRQQDNWEPLLAIADHAGAHWPEEARRAALELSGEKPDDKSTAEELLADVRNIFDAEGVQRIALAELLKKLIEDESAPWQTWNRGKPMTARQLGRRLSEFKIEARTVYIGPYDKPKGFHRDQFVDAWTRYLDGADASSPDTPLPSVTRSPSNESGDFVVTKEVTEKNGFSHLAGQSPCDQIVTDGEGDRCTNGRSPIKSPGNPIFSRQGDRVTDGYPLPAGKASEDFEELPL